MSASALNGDWLEHIPSVEYVASDGGNVEHTDEFAGWYRDLNEAQQDDVTAAGLLLIEQGPRLPFPFSSGINGSKHAHMRELRVQSGGRPLRIFYAFDPKAVGDFADW